MTNTFINSSISLPPVSDLRIPSVRTLNKSIEYTKPYLYKKITLVEYLTDPLFLYIGAWGAFTFTRPFWEEIELDINQFESRVKLEPFASGRIDPVTRVDKNNNTVLRTDFYVKNIIEPVYFTYFALYLRAKNYHPAIFVAEIIALSILYEFTIRPFFMNASFEQLLKNPGISIAVAILFDELSNFLLSTPYKALHALAYIFNPFNALPTSRIQPMLYFDPFQKEVSIETIIRL